MVSVPAPRLVVLGIDPGTHVCGWGVVSSLGGRLTAEGYGVVRARATDPIERRLGAIARGLREVVARHAPQEAAIEEVFHGRDVRAAVRIGEGRGAALVVLDDARVPVSGYANNVVKHAVTGAGRAGKERVRAMVRAILSLASLEGPLDASDALALAICHHHARRTAAASGGVPAGRYAPRLEAAIRAMKAAESARAAGGARVTAIPLSLAKKASVAELDGESVVLDLESGRYFSVNRSGTVLLRLLGKGTDRAALEGALVAAFGLPADAAKKDVEHWLALLEARGLLAAPPPASR